VSADAGGADDGELDQSEFLSVLKKAKAWSLDQPRDAGIVRAMNNVWDCVRRELP
jgi:hypothetical protein